MWRAARVALAAAAVAIAIVATGRGGTSDLAAAVSSGLARIASTFTTVPRTLLGADVGAGSSILAAGSATASDEWLTFNGDAWRSGINPREHTLDASNVGRLKLIWSARVPGPIDSSPVYRDRRLYLTLTNGGTVAFDTDAGRLVWAARTSGPRYTTSTPVLDPDGPWVYSYGRTGTCTATASTPAVRTSAAPGPSRSPPCRMTRRAARR